MVPERDLVMERVDPELLQSLREAGLRRRLAAAELRAMLAEEKLLRARIALKYHLTEEDNVTDTGEIQRKLT